MFAMIFENANSLEMSSGDEEGGGGGEQRSVCESKRRWVSVSAGDE